MCTIVGAISSAIATGFWDQNGRQQPDGQVVGESRSGVQGQEEEVLDDDRSARNESSCEGGVFFEPSPGKVDVEQQEQDAQAND